MVESVYGMPAACAARQAMISPSPCIMPPSPIGPSASGTGTCSPRIVVAVLRWSTFTQHALAQLDALHVGAVGAQRLLVVGAGVGVIEEHLRHVAPRALPQVLDAGHVLHARLPPVRTLLDSMKSVAF